MKGLSKIAAATAAFIMASSITAVTAFAGSSNSCSSDYPWYNSVTNMYYSTRGEAVDAYADAEIYNAYEIMRYELGVDSSGAVSSTYRYYCPQTGRYYKSYSDASDDALYRYNVTNPTITDKWSEVSRIDYSTSVSSTYRYYCPQTGKYYKSQNDASNDALYNYSYSNPTITDKWSELSRIDSSNYVSSTYRYYCTQTGKYYKSQSDASNDALYNYSYSNPTIYDAYSIDSASYGSPTYPWYSSYTRKYYKTQSDAISDSNSNSSYVKYYLDYSSTVSSTYPWYSSYTKKYYKTQADALTDSNNNSSYVSYAYLDSSSTVSSTYPWYSSYTKKYYKSQSDALTASNNNSTFVSYAYVDSSSSVSSTYPWYSSYTRKYYKTQADALAASNNNYSYVSYAYVDSSNTLSATYPWYSSYTGKYYKSKSDAVNASNNNSSYVKYAYTIPSGTPYISNNKSYSGWSGIADYLKKASSGSTVTVNMNGAEIVGSEALRAIDGRNISVQFTLKNGVKWTVNGSSVNMTDSISISSEFRSVIPSKVMKPYTKKAVSKVQVVLGDDEPFGFTAKISLKFNTSRAGRKAYVYRYNDEDNTLTKVVTTKISSTGYCTFSTDEGGAYVIILK